MADREKPSHNQVPKSPEGDELIVEHLQSIVEILKNLETRAEARNRKTHKDIFKDIISEPSVVVALFTVLVGGLLGAYITNRIQSGAKDREFQQSQLAKEREFDQTWLKARGDQALISYKEHLDQEQGLIRRTYSLIGTCSSVADSLMSVTGPAFRQRFLGESRTTVERQISGIRQNYNQTAAKWQSERQEIGILMGYYHPNQKDIAVSWQQAEDSVTNYLECAQVWHNSNQPPKAPTDEEVNDACRDQHDMLSESLNNLSVSLESKRHYAWAGWESPQQLKSLLENQNSTPTK